MNYIKLTVLIMFVFTAAACNKETTKTEPQKKQEQTQQPANNGGNTGNNNGNNQQPDETLTFSKKAQPLVLFYTSLGSNNASWGHVTQGRYKDIEGITSLAVHVGADDFLTTSCTDQLYANNSIVNRYVPQFWVNDKYAMAHDATSADLCNSHEIVYDIVKSEKQKTNKPYLAAKVLKDSNGSVELKYGVKFEGGMPDGEYSVAAYLVEENVKHPVYAMYYDCAIRMAANNSTFGQTFTKADLTGSVFTHTGYVMLEDHDKEELYIVLALWKKNGYNDYTAVCGHHMKLY